VSKAKGSRAELKAIRILEAAGYVCTKAGGSLGVFDVIALGPNDVRCVQVKAGKHPWLSPLEREAIAIMALPANVSKELWKFRDYAREPVIEVLR
jgi:Holliday junction resolvase